MQIISRRFILVRSLLEDVLSQERKANEDRISALRKQGLTVKTLFHTKDLAQKDPSGLEVSLGDFRIDRETVDQKMKYSLWNKLPAEVSSKDTEFFLECREYAPQHAYNKVFCSIDGKDLVEDYTYGPNYASYLSLDEAVEVQIGNTDYLKIRRCWIDFSPQGDSIRVCKETIWRGPLSNFPKSAQGYSVYNSALERCLNNLRQRNVSQTASVPATK